jgi:anti-sigma factor RsiW
MTTDHCREWRESLGAHALDRLPAEERAAVAAHLAGCPGCRAEADSLGAVAHLLPLADPARIEVPAPRPSPALGERVAAALGAQRRLSRRRRQRRFGLALSGAAAATLLAILLLGGGGDSSPAEHVEFASLPAGVSIGATLEPHAYGTEVRVYVKGIRSGTLCRVFLRGPGGVTVPAGTFRYRWGDDSTATLSSALDLSRTRAIGIRAGGRTFLASVELG